jgi:hypothetical protein
VPFLNLVLGFPFSVAAAISLTTVIATSSSVSAGRSGKQLINMKLGMLLEVATAAGSLLGGVTAQLIAQSVLQKLFGIVAGDRRADHVESSQAAQRDPRSGRDPGVLGGRYYEAESRGGGHLSGEAAAAGRSRLLRGRERVVAAGHRRRHHQVPILNAWCGIPLRAAAATSAFMIGVTATAGAIIYYGHGQLEPALAAPAVLGVQLGRGAACGSAPPRRRSG